MSELIVEVWKSNQNQTEIHLYIPNEQNSYLIGFNPDIISVDTIKRLIAPLGYTFTL
jgi:hypothetical protein